MSLTNASPELAARAAKVSSRTLATLSEDARNRALDAVHDALANARDEILAANAVDLEKAKKATSDGELNPSIYKRLDLARPGKFDDMLQGIRDVRGLPDPGRCRWLLICTLNDFLLGHVLRKRQLANCSSRTSGSAHSAGRWSHTPAPDLPNRSAINHLRGPTGSDSQHCFSCDQVCQLSNLEGRQRVYRIVQGHCIDDRKSSRVYRGTERLDSAGGYSRCYRFAPRARSIY